MERVLVAMSGGVDSSVAALLLQEQGYDCIGVTMRLVVNETCNIKKANTCCSAADVEDARSVCARMGMPHYVIDMTEDFDEQVIRRFVNSYEAGLTPNPCILCNRYLKFELLWEKAQLMGCDKIATGHYARVVTNPAFQSVPGSQQAAQAGEKQPSVRLFRAADAIKDQTYVLYPIQQEVLNHTLLPLGDFASKAEVRALAEKHGFVTAKKHDSQDICFVPDGDYGAFLEHYQKRPEPLGSIVDTSGKLLGQHRGMARYTIGQRKGLGVAAGKRLYVVDKNAKTNTVVLGSVRQLYCKQFCVSPPNWIGSGLAIARQAREEKEPFRAQVVTRYHGTSYDALVEIVSDGSLRVTPDEPISAVAPGQAAVLYLDGELLGGGSILLDGRELCDLDVPE